MITQSTDISGSDQHLEQLVEAGQLNEAMNLAVDITTKHPDDARAWYTLAGIYAQLQQLDEVIACCKQVTRLNPDQAGAHYNLAIGLQQTGHLSEAASSYRECLRINPCNIRVLMNLGRLLGQQGNHEDALQLFQQAVEVDSGYPDAYYCSGIQLQAIGRLSEAATAYQKAIHIRPDFFEATNNLGHVLSELGELNKALGVFESLLCINPESPEAHNNIGIVYDSMGKAREAEASYRKAIALNPTLADTRCHLGYLLAAEGRTREALECFDTNLELFPAHESSIAGKAVALEKLGQLDDANKALESTLVATTDNPDLVLSYCTIMLRKNDTAGAIRQAERLLATSSIPPKGMADLSFALGNLYEKKRDYSSAFHYFKPANSITPCTYSHEEHVSYISSIIASTEKEMLARIPRARHTFRKMIFIVGMPRSGTSLIEQILASHPDVFGAGELTFLSDIAASFPPLLARGKRYPENLANLTQSNTDALAKRYIDPVEELADESRLITDKMPHNFLNLALISVLFPKARVIHVKRSPLDNCLSLYFHSFNPMHSYTTDMGFLGRYYNEYLRLMAHWGNTLDIPVLEVSYEDVVNDLESSTRRLLEFCQLDWSEDCLNFFASKRFVKTPSYNQVRQPIYTSSVNRWKNYREFITPLESALGLDRVRPSPLPEGRGSKT